MGNGWCEDHMVPVISRSSERVRHYHHVPCSMRWHIYAGTGTLCLVWGTLSHPAAELMSGLFTSVSLFFHCPAFIFFPCSIVLSKTKQLSLIVAAFTENVDGGSRTRCYLDAQCALCRKSQFHRQWSHVHSWDHQSIPKNLRLWLTGMPLNTQFVIEMLSFLQCYWGCNKLLTIYQKGKKSVRSSWRGYNGKWYVDILLTYMLHFTLTWNTTVII